VEECSVSVDLLAIKEERIKETVYIDYQKAKKIKKRKFNKSLWTLNENIKYCEFIRENIALFES
jgi:hypothetical protein